MFTYIQIIGLKYPNVQCYALGEGADYNTLIYEAGDPIPSKDELDSAIVVATREKMWEGIKAKREEVRFGGVLVGLDWFHSDDSSRIQLSILLSLGLNLPEGITIKTLANDLKIMTPELVQGILSTLMVKEQTAYAVAEAHKVNLYSSVEPASYDFSDNWPAIFVA